MRIVVSSSEVPALTRRHGGRLFVWKDPHRCCGGAISYLVTALEPRVGHELQLFEAEDFELGSTGEARVLQTSSTSPSKGFGRSAPQPIGTVAPW
jgi:hypothetical protein